MPFDDLAFYSLSDLAKYRMGLFFLIWLLTPLRLYFCLKSIHKIDIWLRLSQVILFSMSGVWTHWYVSLGEKSNSLWIYYAPKGGVELFAYLVILKLTFWFLFGLSLVG